MLFEFCRDGPGFVRKKMAHYQAEDADYVADEYDMEDVDEDMDDKFRDRDVGSSDSDVDEFEFSVGYNITSVFPAWQALSWV